MLRIATIQSTMLTALACAGLLTMGCGGNSSTGAVCGDGVIAGSEVCDDGNTVNGDGCSSTCTVEGAECGNGIIETGEECDDGNTANGDGCSSVCSLEVAPGCGNGVVEMGEGCDDGNSDACDGCSATCSLEVCGNGVTECTEQCDDGNSTSGDGCDAGCQLEAGGCGDGVIDTGEECDDGNTTAGDGCDATCQLEVTPGCGNGVVEVGEDCDDGNTDACDGCSATCVDEVCGDGVVECTEQCDDGNTTAGDGCDANCQTEVTAVCGNGTVEGAEQCDDGNASNLDACLNSCLTASCGDNYVQTGVETCDDGNTANGDGCDSVCQTEVTPVCGNGTVEGAEQCDDGNASNADACLNSCLTASCGDNYVQTSVETCDDGNTANGDGCDSNCQLEIVPGCGNGVIEGAEACDDNNNTACDGCSATCTIEECGNNLTECAEECDDGNTADGDGCDSTCHTETPLCTEDFVLACGDDDFYNNSWAGSTDVIDADGCWSLDESGPEYTYSFTATASESVTVNLSGMSGDLDLFVIDDQGGVCDSGNCSQFGDNTLTFSAVAGTTYYLVVDGYEGAVSDYYISVVCPSAPSCGDGTVDAGEQCDDGNLDDTDACVSGCTDAICGDGYVHATVEQCDDANSDDTDSCRNNCTIPACGDGILDNGETCDDGNTNAGDGCDASCAPEYCIDDYPLTCGASDTYNNSWGGSTNILTTYPCAVGWDESGPEFAYIYTAANSGQVTLDLTVNTAGEDLDVFVISQSNGLCSPTDCVAAGDNQATFTAVAGETYYIIVEGFEGSVADYTIDMTCVAAPACGDGNTDFGEECDDGNLTNGDGCDSICEWETTECSPAWPLDCGGSDTYNNNAGGHTNNVPSYACAAGWDESGPEYTYVFQPANSGDVTIDLSGMSADLDIFVLTPAGFACDPAECTDSGDNTVTFTAVANQLYLLVVDGFQGAVGDYTIDVSCTNP